MTSRVDEVWEDWKGVVNMTAREMDKWLATDKSKAMGDESGEHITRILRSPKADLTDDDVDHMRRVVENVQRLLGQRPFGDVRETRWRYSLMNRGHDPLKD